MSADWSGLASAIGRLGQQRHERQDFDLKANTSAILDDVKRLQDRRSQLPAGDPGLKEIDDSLAEHQRVFSELVQHNKVNPDQIAGLFSSAAGTKPAEPKDPYLTPDELKKKARITAGLEPRAVEPKPEAENWATSDVTFADGTKATLQHNTKSGVWTDLAGNPVPKERLSTASVAPKAAGKDKYAWTKKNGKFVSVKLDANGQIIPGSENPNILPPASLTGRISTGQYHFVDEKGQVHEVQETRSSMPAGQGNGQNVQGGGNVPSAPEGLKVKGNINLNNRPVLHNSDGTVSTERSFSIGTEQGEVLIPRIYDGKDHTEQEAIQHYKQTGQHMGIFDTPEHADAYAQAVHNRGTTKIPTTAGEAKARVKTPESRDKVIGFKGNKDYTDTKSSYEGAVDRAKTMDQNLVNALNGDQQAMLSLVANHIGMTLGAQKGARITRAVWDEAVSSTPWLQKVAAKWSDDGYLSGVTLAPEQMRQMVRLGHEKVHTLKEHLDRLNSERTDPDAPNKAAGGSKSSGKAVSLAAARKLESMRGKSDDEIKVAIKAAGHEVAP